MFDQVQSPPTLDLMRLLETHVTMLMPLNVGVGIFLSPKFLSNFGCGSTDSRSNRGLAPGG